MNRSYDLQRAHLSRRLSRTASRMPHKPSRTSKIIRGFKECFDAHFFVLLIFRGTFPLSLLAASIVRFNGFSFVYLLLLMITPFLQTPDRWLFQVQTGRFFKFVIVVSGTACLSHLIFYFVMSTTGVTDKTLMHCTRLESILRYIGLQRIDDTDWINAIRLLLPDIIILLTSLLHFTLCNIAADQVKITPQKRPLFRHLHNFLIVVCVLFTGLNFPSLISLGYFLLFWIVASLWALCRKVFRYARCMYVLVTVYSGLHIILMYGYQIAHLQKTLHPTSFNIRVLGITAFQELNCDSPNIFHFHKHLHWFHFLNPILVLAVYWFTALRLKWKIKRKEIPAVVTEIDVPANEINEDGSVFDDSVAVKIEEPEEKSPKTTTSKDRTEIYIQNTVHFLTKQCHVLSPIFMMVWSITFHSWLTMILMFWALLIWIHPQSKKVALVTSPGFYIYGIFLIFLQYVWSFQLNEDEVPSISTQQFGLHRYEYPILQFPLMCFYQLTFLLTLHRFVEDKLEELRNLRFYLDHDPEAPNMHKGENFYQEMTESSSRQPLIEEIFTTKPEDRFSLSELNKSRLGQLIVQVLSRYWNVVCCCMFQLVSLNDGVVLYRIIYMVFFLFFVTVYQFSYKVWWRMTHVFWWVVVIYSMITLTVIYMSQFDMIANLKDNTTLAEATMRDLGLEKFNSAELILRLGIPTAFFLVVVIQLRYFGKPPINPATFENSFLGDVRMAHILERGSQERLLKESNFYTLSPKNSVEVLDSDLSNTHECDTVEEADATDVTEKDHEKQSDVHRDSVFAINIDLHDFKDLAERQKVKMKKGWNKFIHHYDYLTALIWRIFEIHMLKIVSTAIFVVCAYDVCFINCLLLISLMLTLFFPKYRFWYSKASLFVTSFNIVSTMIYQLSYIQRKQWQVNCFEEYANSSEESVFVVEQVQTTDFVPDPLAFLEKSSTTTQLPMFDQTTTYAADYGSWIGLKKVAPNSTIFRTVLGNLIIVFLLVFEVVIHRHQIDYFRMKAVKPPQEGILFPEVTRKHADEGLLSCFKFLCNYFFYKFGVEVCFCSTIVTVALRLDVYSVIYALWLGLLINLRRENLAKIWTIYLGFLAFLLPFQYVFILGLPPQACIPYPWSNIGSESLREWLFLPSYRTRPRSTVLVADFMQLLFVVLQRRVFLLEPSHRGSHDKGGGDNFPIRRDYIRVKDIPVADFTRLTNSLDRVKIVIFSYSFWITLVLVTIIGITRVSIFCAGYVTLSLIYMWMGQEFLTKPHRKIVKQWNVLVIYTYLVILIKSSLQLVACVLMETITFSNCWFVQLTGMICFKPGFKNNVTDPECLIPTDNGLHWDSLCFALTLIVRRIFSTYYFHYSVMELREQTEQASRGAFLFNTLHRKMIRARQLAELKSVTKLKSAVGKIRVKRANRTFDNQNAAEFDDDEKLFESDDSETESQEEAKSQHSQSEDETVKFLDVETTEQQPTPSPIMPQLCNSCPNIQTDDYFNDLNAEVKIRNSSASAIALANSCSSDSCNLEVSLDACKRQTRLQRGVVFSVDDESDLKSAISTLSSIKNISNPRKRFLESMKLIWKILLKSIDGFIYILSDATYDYRLVAFVLKSERIIKREEELAKACKRENKHRTKLEKQKSILKNEKIQNLRDPEEPLLEIMPESSRIMRLLMALLYTLFSKSEFVCYSLMVINHMNSASCLSFPLPILVFVWAMLSVPRPDRKFWILVITYTASVLSCKYLFQFPFFPWNRLTKFLNVEKNPYWAPRILGIERKDDYAYYDVALLIALFAHRSIMKKHGLWRHSYEGLFEDEVADVEHLKMVKKFNQQLSMDDSDDDVSNFPNDMSNTDSESYEEEDEEIVVRFYYKVWFVIKKLIVIPVRDFYSRLTDPNSSAVTDVYAPMFFCDVITCVIVIFAWWAFSDTPDTDDAYSMISNNKIPETFLFLLLCHFLVIVIDRALYLKKFVLGKFIFQMAFVAIVHIWMFFILPLITNKKFVDNTPAKMWYFVRCIYFGLSAYQIKCGYPTRILGNFLTKHYSLLNMMLFKGFGMVPFLSELRWLMDWMYTDTTLSLTHWLQLEDTYAHVYQIKCQITFDEDFPHKRGTPKSWVTKYVFGGTMTFVLFATIWFPLLFMSLVQSISKPNPPTEFALTVQLGGYEPLFKVTVQQPQLFPISSQEYSNLFSQFRNDKAVHAFLLNYQRSDITKAVLNGNSTAKWTVSPPSRQALIEELKSNHHDQLITINWNIKRTIRSSMVSETVSGKAERHWEVHSRYRLLVAEMLTNHSRFKNKGIQIESFIPRFFHSPAMSPSLLPLVLTNKGIGWCNVTASFRNTDVGSEWWEFTEIQPAGENRKPQEQFYIYAYIFSDKVIPSELGFIAGKGIVGMYLSFVLVIGQFVRMNFRGQAFRIMFDELPNVDRILKLIQNIFLVRESRDFDLEEDLFDKLVLIMRSPELLMKWTKPKV